MIQNLLHASVVLSKQQVARHEKRCWFFEGSSKIPADRKVAIITYVGSRGDQTHFLIRVAKPYKQIDYEVFKSIFGYLPDYTTSYTTDGECRHLLTLKEDPPEDPAAFTKAFAQKMARAFAEHTSVFAGY